MMDNNWLEIIFSESKSYFFSQERKRRLFKLFKRCYICKTENDLVIHHVVPRSEHGGNEVANIMVLCRKCHKRVHRILINNKMKKLYGYCYNKV